MLGYCIEMSKTFGTKNTVTLLILRLGVLFYPILSAIGVGLHAPIGVIVEDEGMVEWIVEVLCGFAEPRIISLSERQCDFKKRVAVVKYELLAVLCKTISAHNRENLSYLNDLMVSKSIGDKVFSKLPVIFFIGGIPLELSDLLAGKIIFEGNVKGGSLGDQRDNTRQLLESFDYRSASRNEWIDMLCKDTQGNPFLDACQELSLRALRRRGETDEMTGWPRMVRSRIITMKEEWLISYDYSAWIEKMRDLILEEGKGFTASVDRKAVFSSERTVEYNVLFYDTKYYYITEQMFEKACRRIKYYISPCEMKQALAEADILVGEGENRKYYSIKLPISTPNGIRTLGRRMRIIRAWIDQPGELAWHEQISSRREVKESDGI